MRHRWLLWTVLATLPLLLGSRNAAEDSTIMIHDVTVIDGTGSPPRGDVDLVLRDGRIASLEDAHTYRHPAGAQVIDGRGKYAIPGLIDMHAHVAGDVLNEKGEPGHGWNRDVFGAAIGKRLRALPPNSSFNLIPFAARLNSGVDTYQEAA